MQVPANHPAFDGHFPGQPIVPGVVLLDWCLAQLRADAAVPDLLRGPVRFDTVKFMHTATPGDALHFGWTFGTDSCRFTVHCNDQLAVSGVLKPLTTGTPPPGHG